MENQNALKLIEESRYILILTHLNPDADTISCALALSNYMFENKIKHKVFNVSKKIPRNLSFLPKFDKITNQLPKFYDLVIYVDCADQKRVGIDIDSSAKVINIDHHQSNTNFADINIVNDKKASAAEVVYDFFEQNNIHISKNVATCLYVGIYDDSIAFTTPRTDTNTFRVINNLIDIGIKPSEIAINFSQKDSLARYRIMPKILKTLELQSEGKIATIFLKDKWLKSTGASVEECDDIVNMILKISVVEVVCYLRIVDNKVRVSLRSKSDFDVSKIAKIFNGGGHKNAAGLSVETSNIKDAKSQIVKTIQSYI